MVCAHVKMSDEMCGTQAHVSLGWCGTLGYLVTGNSKCCSLDNVHIIPRFLGILGLGGS